MYVFSVYKYSEETAYWTRTHEYITHYCRPDKFCMCFFRCLIQLIGLGFVHKTPSFRVFLLVAAAAVAVIAWFPQTAVCMCVCVCASPSLCCRVYVSALLMGEWEGELKWRKQPQRLNRVFPFISRYRTRKHIDLFISFRRFSIWEFESPLCVRVK